MADTQTSNLTKGLVGLAITAGIIFIIFWAGSAGISAGKNKTA